MNLKQLLVDKKSAWVDFPGLKGFQVQVVNLSRTELNALTKKCTKTKFNRGSAPTQQLDTQKFVEQFTAKTVINWKGLKYQYLQQLVLVDISGQDMNTQLPYSKQNAQLLVEQSGQFDSWLNEVVFDLGNFRNEVEVVALEKAEKATG